MTLHKLAALALAAWLSLGAGKPAPRNWNAVVAVTPAGGHQLGNPAAQLKLVAFVSYTCPHCAQFEQESEAMLRLNHVAPGKLSVEVRNFVRDPIDLAVALLTNCGAPSGFFLRHSAFLRNQHRWIERLGRASPAQAKRWSSGPLPQRMRYVAADFGFYELAAARGVDRRSADRCLASEAMAKRLAEGTAAAEKLGVNGTPSFTLDGLLLAGTHDWATLAPQIQARF